MPQACQAEPPHGAELSLNLLLHTFVFLVVLTALYQFLISPMESKALEKEVRNSTRAAVGAVLQNVSPSQAATLKSILPALTTMQRVSPIEDAARVAHNNQVLSLAWAVSAALGLSFVVTVCVMAACRIRMGRMLGHVLAENAILLLILGAVEGGFFLMVASKYVPVLPSVLSTQAVATLKQQVAQATAQATARP